MRNLLTFFTVIFLFTACNEGLDPQVLQQENDELRSQLSMSAEYVDNVTGIIDEIQQNLFRIEQREGLLSNVPIESEGSDAIVASNVRDQVLDGLEDIDTYIEENRKKLDDLTEQMEKSTYRVGSLERLVSNLKATVQAKEDEVAGLRASLTERDQQIASLETVVAEKEKVLEDNTIKIDAQEEEISSQLELLRKQEEDLTTAWYVVGTNDMLKQTGIINEKRAGFLKLRKKREVVDPDKQHFRKIRTFQNKLQLAADVGKVEVLSQHKNLTDAYSVVYGDDATTFVIRDLDKFWNVSKYLVLKVDRS